MKSLISKSCLMAAVVGGVVAAGWAAAPASAETVQWSSNGIVHQVDYRDGSSYDRFVDRDDWSYRHDRDDSYSRHERHWDHDRDYRRHEEHERLERRERERERLEWKLDHDRWPW